MANTDKLHKKYKGNPFNFTSFLPNTGVTAITFAGWWLISLVSVFHYLVEPLFTKYSTYKNLIKHKGCLWFSMKCTCCLSCLNKEREIWVFTKQYINYIDMFDLYHMFKYIKDGLSHHSSSSHEDLREEKAKSSASYFVTSSVENPTLTH